jgi:hypothetical protein
MGHSKFAAITADLLARKGDARPWQPTAPTLVEIATAPLAVANNDHRRPEHDEPDIDFEPPGALPPAGPNVRRCSLRLTNCEYQRVGIVAVKRNTTRQRILRQAIEKYLAALEREYGNDCGCLSGHGCSPDTWPQRES